MQTTKNNTESLDRSTIQDRDKKYITCLRLVELVVNREIGSILSEDYYENLGRVASFIDRSLDALTLTQKAKLLEDFNSLFAHLIDSENQERFNALVLQFIVRNGIDLNYTLSELYAVRTFIQFQKKHQLVSELQSFGKNIISISIRQELAESSAEITALLKQEGQLVIKLLESNLKQFTSNYSGLKKTINLLTEFEQILNLGDDFLDVNKDFQKRKLNNRHNVFHRFTIMKLCHIFFFNPDTQ
ncbi:MAG: hypothetical protein ACPGTP_02890, partial [Bacteroidia bacterium]